MPLQFEKYAQKGAEFLNNLAISLGDSEDKDRAGRILRSVFHVLRDHLTLEESFQFLSQLPMALKALYVDSWIPQKHVEKGRTLTHFINEVISEDGGSSWRDFTSAEDVLDAVYAVFSTLRKHVSEGELHNMEAVLPKDMKVLLQKQDNRDIVIEFISDL